MNTDILLMECLNDDTKQLILDEINNSKANPLVKQKLSMFINEIDHCEIPIHKKGKKGERKLTDYNRFMSPCLKNEEMKLCVPKWRKIKDCVKENGLESCMSQVGY